jgi:hypothetical protein
MQFMLEFRILASVALWLDQEEEPVQLVPEDFKELPLLSKKLFPSDYNLLRLVI